MPSGAPQAYEGAQSVEAKHVILTGTKKLCVDERKRGWDCCANDAGD